MNLSSDHTKNPAIFLPAENSPQILIGGAL